MIWVLGALTFLHILAAVGWWGTTATLQAFVVPAARKLSAEEQVAWWRSLTVLTKRYLAPVAGLTILLGIVRGIAGGVFDYLNTPYGYTWIAALVVGIALAIWGARVTGPHAERLGESTPENVAENVAGIQRVGRIEQAGFALILALMVAMRFGY